MSQDNETLRYGIADAAEMSGISAFTIRYYDKCGLLPNLERGENGIRMFSEDDVQQLLLVDALRKSGLSIDGIQYFVRMQIEGPKAAEEQRSILRGQTTSLECQIADLQACLIRLKAAENRLEPNEQ